MTSHLHLFVAITITIKKLPTKALHDKKILNQNIIPFRKLNICIFFMSPVGIYQNLICESIERT